MKRINRNQAHARKMARYLSNHYRFRVYGMNYVLDHPEWFI